MTTPTDTEIVLSRVFDAPRRLVFDAWTRPELLKRWFGARGWNLVVCEVDLRVGGAWRFVSRGPDGSDMGHGGVYREVVPPGRLVYTELFDDQSYPGESLITHEFVEQNGKTALTSTLRYASREGRDRVLSYPMQRGVGEGFDRLSEVLAEMLRRANTGPTRSDVTGKGDVSMNWTLEVVVVPVSDVDRAKAFYAEQLGFNVDHDSRGPDGSGPVQLTPPGSGCSIVLGKGLVDMAPGSLQGLQLVVPDLRAARAELVKRGVAASEVQVFGESGLRPSRDGDELDNVGFVFFSDPDGNGWGVQQISARR